MEVLDLGGEELKLAWAGSGLVLAVCVLAGEQGACSCRSGFGGELCRVDRLVGGSAEGGDDLELSR